jgi:hypothetical protein
MIWLNDYDLKILFISFFLYFIIVRKSIRTGYEGKINILTPTFQSDPICCWSVWRYIMIRCICNSYSIILKYNSTHRFALDEQESFCISNTIPYFKLLFVYLMPENVDWIHKNSHEEILPHTLLDVASSSYIFVKSFTNVDQCRSGLVKV